MRVPNSKGFTLVELAIVMTIIGLLIGGILKGQELMENARVTATAAQIKSYEAAMTSFKDIYQATPGDMPLAGTRLQNCPGAAGVSCNPGATNAGDGIIGLSTWASGGFLAPGTVATVAAGCGAALMDCEKYLFWSHLLLANLIGGVTIDGLRANTAFSFGVTHPQAKIAGGLSVGYQTGVNEPGSLNATANQGLSGTVLYIANSPVTALQTTTTNLPLSSLRAAMLDRKMDDGRPSTGFVHAYGVGATCFTLAATLQYAESLPAKDCGLMWRIEG